MKRYLLSLIFVALCLMSSLAMARDYYLSVGGGYEPSMSQGVLELNMKNFYARVNKTNAEKSLIQLYGGGCNPDSLDVYTTAKEFSLEDRLFAVFFKAHDDAECVWRHNQIPSLNGASTKENLEHYLNEHKDWVKHDDSFRFYFTGHGSQNDEVSQMDLWGIESDMKVPEFVSKLDEYPEESPTQVLMVQCYSGGFANMNYKGGDPKAELSSHQRCGFFSQLPDRLAAGCTPDLEQREEYSRYFLEASQSKTEKGQVINVDYNKDGVVGSDEAHAYVVAHEKSIDVPISTSSWLLRQKNVKIKSKQKGLSLKEFRNIMNASESVVLSALLKSTGLSMVDDDRALLKVKAAIKSEKDLQASAKDAREKAQEYLDKIFTDIKFDLKERFPIFYTTYGITLGTQKVLNSELAGRARAALKKHPKYQIFKAAFVSRDKASNVEELWERRVVQLERLEYLLETKLMEESLKNSKSTIMQRYKELKTCESKPYF
jgi:hypothetical protein